MVLINSIFVPSGCPYKKLKIVKIRTLHLKEIIDIQIRNLNGPWINLLLMRRKKNVFWMKYWTHFHCVMFHTTTVVKVEYITHTKPTITQNPLYVYWVCFVVVWLRIEGDFYFFMFVCMYNMYTYLCNLVQAIWLDVT